MPRIDSDKILQQSVNLLERASDKLEHEIESRSMDANFISTAAEIRGFLSASQAFEYIEKTAQRRRGTELEASPADEGRTGDLHGTA